MRRGLMNILRLSAGRLRRNNESLKLEMRKLEMRKFEMEKFYFIEKSLEVGSRWHTSELRQRISKNKF